jgi:hypothetical protein
MADPRAEKPNPDKHPLRSPSGADLVSLLLLILFGFGIWAVVERGFTELLRDEEPSEQKTLDAYGVTKQKTELTDVQTELTDLQKSLNAARLDQLKQNAAVQSFVTTYPELASAASPTSMPPDITKAYTETRRQERLTTTLVAALEQRLATLKEQQTKLSSDVETRKEAAESQLRRANGWFALLKRGGTFFITLLIFAVLLLIVRSMLWALAKKRMSTAEGFRPFALALGALVLLFAYEQFSFAGAALVGVLLLLLILRRIKWPNKSNAPAQ